MKRILLFIGVIVFSLQSYSQIYNLKTKSAYSSINIESKQDYDYRQSHQGQDEATYSSYTGEKNYIFSSFYSRDYSLAYKLTSDGRIIDYKNDILGRYFVGEKMYYKCYKVYIRWDHGGETSGSLNYGERTDGKPKFRIKKGTGSGMSVYNP